MAIDLDAMDELDRERLRETGFFVPGLGSYEMTTSVREKPKRKQQGRGENQLERDFERHLHQWFRVNHIWVKPMVLRIGPVMTFEPDFMVFDEMDCETYVIDTKGPISWEDSRIKIKITAEKFPMWKWLIVTRPGGAWRAKEVTAAKGISRKFIDLPWLN